LSRKIRPNEAVEAKLQSGDIESTDIEQNYTQWTTSDNHCFFPASKTSATLIPGLYEIRVNSNGQTYFERLPISTEGLVKFPDTTTSQAIDEMETFWKQEDRYKKFGLTFKRGVLFWGPPGGGKTCTIRILIQELIKRHGVVIKFTTPTYFSQGVRQFRDIQPKTPVIILMEDLDAILDKYNESEVINIIDGIDFIDGVVFLATTNHPEKLSERILNRPSRFDKRYKIGMPSARDRKIYLESLLKKERNVKINLDKWVKDTEKLSLAHLRELFIRVNFLNNEYDESLQLLRDMFKPISSEDDKGKVSLNNED
jgi:AAA+ superfamily predicted ATPase